MIADLKPYAEYKDSGLPWVGPVPKHWNLIPNRGLVRKRKVLVGRRHSDYQLLSLTKQGVIVRDISAGKGTFSSDMGTSQEVRDGDLIFCLFDVPETPRTVGLSRHEGMITGAYTVFESVGKSSSEYLEMFYRAMDDRKLLSPLYSGLRNTIPIERFLGTKTPQPECHEQMMIVRFLNWANGRLERAIRAKRKVIALLSEQKQAIIHRAVTRGLDDSVPLKPSGIPWLGDIPQHWNFGKVKRFFRTCSGATPSSGQISLYYDGTIPYYDGTIPWIRTMDLNNGIVDTYAVGITQRAIDDTACKVLPVGSVLVAMYGGAGTIGKNGLLAIEASTNQALCALLPSHRFLPKFVLFFMQYQRRYWMVGADGTRKDPNISQDRIRESVIILPPLPEQQRIVEHIEPNTGELQIAISRLEREIDLLREYRTRLVSDVVTGKLDVREASKRLPGEASPDISQNDADLSDQIEPADEEAVV